MGRPLFPLSYGALEPGGRIRTPDLVITSDLLFRLSYPGLWNAREDLNPEPLVRSQVLFPVELRALSLYLEADPGFEPRTLTLGRYRSIR